MEPFIRKYELLYIFKSLLVSLFGNNRFSKCLGLKLLRENGEESIVNNFFIKL